MKRREFIALFGGGAAAWPFAAGAQQFDRLRRIGMLTPVPESDSEGQQRVQTVLKALHELGWKSGTTLDIVFRWGGTAELIRINAKQLVDLRPDVILSTGTQVTAVVRQHTSTIPIVFVNVADPVDSGFVSSWAQPGGNATGFAAWELSIGSKWLELLKEIAPNVSRALVLLNPDNPTWRGHVRTIEAAAKLLTVDLRLAHVQTPADIEHAVAAFARDPGAGMIVLPSGVTQNQRKSIIDAAEQHRMPAIYPYRFHAASGALVSFGTDPLDLFRRAAAYIDAILKGAKPNDLPVQAPSKFELVVNLKTARALGLTIPPTLLARADEVIE